MPTGSSENFERLLYGVTLWEGFDFWAFMISQFNVQLKQTQYVIPKKKILFIEENCLNTW